MLIGSPSGGDGFANSAFTRAAAADLRAEQRLRHKIGDLFLPDEARLSDRARSAAHAVLAGIVAAAEAELRREAARLLAARGARALADQIFGGEPVLGRLAGTGLLRDPELMDELIARVELDLLSQALPPFVPEPERLDLMAVLTGSPDDEVATAAVALVGAENRRRAANGGATIARGELSAELHQRLLWWVAAVIREQSPDLDGMADRDRALTEATLRSLAAHDEGDRPEAAAARLAEAIDPRPDELADLLVATVNEGRLTLFAALVARAATVEYEQVRRLMIDPGADLLPLLLRVVGVERTVIARIGVALAEADVRRDLEQLADKIEWVEAHDPETARTALAPLALHRDFRAAVRALSQEP